MKKYLLLLVFTVLSFSTFSQTTSLKPKVRLIEKDTSFCFTLQQSRSVAKALQELQYQDSLVVAYELENKGLKRLISIKDNSIDKLQLQLVNFRQINSNHENQMRLLEQTIQVQDQRLKRSKTQKALLSIGVGILAIFTIANN